MAEPTGDGEPGRKESEDEDPPYATVIVPTLNGGGLLQEVLAALEAQVTPWPFEVLQVDSSSTEVSPAGAPVGTRQRRVRRVTIPRADFAHGRTRNLGAALARGHWLIFLVQDATPLGQDWLRTLVEGMEAHPQAVGGAAAQVPRADADPSLARRIREANPPGERPVLRCLGPGERWETLSPRERLARAGLDNVCSIVARSFLLEHPFPDVPFGEDLCWSVEQLRRGYALVYLPGAVVRHSHARSFWQDFSRTRVEHRMLIRELGLRTVHGPLALLRGMASVIRGGLREDRSGLSRSIAELLGQAVAGLER